MLITIQFNVSGDSVPDFLFLPLSVLHILHNIYSSLIRERVQAQNCIFLIPNGQKSFRQNWRLAYDNWMDIFRHVQSKRQEKKKNY